MVLGSAASTSEISRAPKQPDRKPPFRISGGTECHLDQEEKANLALACAL